MTADETMVDLGGGMVVPLREVMDDDVLIEDDYDPADETGGACQTCGGDGFEFCEDQNSSEGCWEAGCTGTVHTCPNCRGSGLAKDQWYW